MFTLHDILYVQRDIYAFGAGLLEIITGSGLPAVGKACPDCRHNLMDKIRKAPLILSSKASTLVKYCAMGQVTLSCLEAETSRREPKGNRSAAFITQSSQQKSRLQGQEVHRYGTIHNHTSPLWTGQRFSSSNIITNLLEQGKAHSCCMFIH
ncbi:hypothetical protein MLD38_000076 [Melastoma candidum]|uniref:Uncharacterized protein n=1 Tax=Melastoma candidum TaxID=119954 RepID=A0ACB9S922_9MYRT|nr:hypothetical protein MLD38_000076 [Melastoma candidum]